MCCRMAPKCRAIYVLNRQISDGAASTNCTTPRTSDTTILAVNSTIFQSVDPYFHSERGLLSGIGRMITQECGQETILPLEPEFFHWFRTFARGYSHRHQHRKRLNQLLIPAQDSCEQIADYRTLFYLETSITSMPHHLNANFFEPGLRGAQRPGID